MKTTFLVFLSIAFAASSFGQNCDCANDLDFVVKYYEANLPGFKDNVNDQNKKQYEKFKKELFFKAKNTKLKQTCFKLLTYYVEFFQDNHSSIAKEEQYRRVNEKNEDSVKAFLNSEIFKATEIYPLKEAALQQYPLNDIRGIYQTKDSMYTIAIIPNKNSFRQYIGVIIDSKTPLWKKGQVKIEFIKPNKKGGYEVFSYNRNHGVAYDPNLFFREGILGNGWFKTSLKSNTVDSRNYSDNDSDKLEYKQLNDSTTYIRIPSFSGDITAQLDSFYKRVDLKIQSKPYLMIDVRNNGGGSDNNVLPLLKYIYTKPFVSDIVDLYVTRDNLKIWDLWYKNISRDTINYNKEYQTEFLEEINRMKKAPLNSFLQRGSGDTIKMDTILAYPKKIAIIMNQYCASSCEALLFCAKESDKTILVGENSGGYVGYGEVGSVNTPCYNFTLYCTKTRYRKQQAFEATGIPPDVRLDNKTDWISQTLKLLTQKNK